MNNKNLWLIRIAMSIIALLSIGGAAAENLVVGVNPDYKPLAYKEDGQLAGIEPATAAATAKLLDKKLVFKELAWQDLIPALQRGDIDVVMSGMSITPERIKQVDFSRSYLKISQMAIIRMQDLARLASPGAMYQQGIRIGVEANTTGESFAKKNLVSATIDSFATPADAFAALRAGKIDFFIHDAPTSWEIAQSDDYNDLFALYRSLTEESLAWAVKKGNSSLLAELNQALSTLESNGTIKMIQSLWMPVKVEVGQ